MTALICSARCVDCPLNRSRHLTFCQECMKAWLLRKEGTACPVCRVPINVDQLQRFALGKGQAQDAPARPVNNEPAPKSRRHFEYNFIDPGVFESIQTMEAHGSYGSKIQTLVRHLLYIQISEPGAKSIVFSAWADSLYSEFPASYYFIQTHTSRSHRARFKAQW